MVITNFLCNGNQTTDGGYSLSYGPAYAPSLTCTSERLELPVYHLHILLLTWASRNEAVEQKYGGAECVCLFVYVCVRVNLQMMPQLASLRLAGDVNILVKSSECKHRNTGMPTACLSWSLM